jgi:hypothetical protein
MRTLTLVAALVLTPAMLPAQSATSDSSAVMTVVHKLFDGMRTHDSAMVRSVFAPGAHLISTGVRNGSPVIQDEAIDGFISAVGKPSTDVWDERIHDPVVQIDGGLATVWVQYAFYLNDKFSHCGVDAFMLAKGAAGWTIVSLADTRRREGCAP